MRVFNGIQAIREVGRLRVACARVFYAVGRLVMPDEEQGFKDAPDSLQESLNLDLDHMVLTFISRFAADLSPKRFALSADEYRPLTFMLVAKELRSILDELQKEYSQTTFVLRMNGSIRLPDDVECRQGHVMHERIASVIRLFRRPPRKEHLCICGEDSDPAIDSRTNTVLIDAMCFLFWIQQALRLRPDLLRGYHVTHTHQEGVVRSVTLTAVSVDATVSEFDPWQVL